MPNIFEMGGGSAVHDYKIGLINVNYYGGMSGGTNTITSVLALDYDDETCTKTVVPLDLSEWDYCDVVFFQIYNGLIIVLKELRIKIDDFHDGDTFTMSETGYGQYGTITRNSNSSVTTRCDSTITCLFKLYKLK